MIYEVGDLVKVALNPGGQIGSADEVWKYQGATKKISRRKTVYYGKGNHQLGIYYELEGVTSNMGVPFGFLEEQLVPAN